jgi:alpha-tubulin suppressor-like RCC1 family protein
VRCWGNNGDGQLGNGTYTDTPSPPTEDALTEVDAITCGEAHTCARMQGGGGRCWGSNTTGQLGNGVVRYFTAALPVPGTCGEVPPPHTPGATQPPTALTLPLHPAR